MLCATKKSKRESFQLSFACIAVFLPSITTASIFISLCWLGSRPWMKVCCATLYVDFCLRSRRAERFSLSKCFGNACNSAIKSSTAFHFDGWLDSVRTWRALKPGLWHVSMGLSRKLSNKTANVKIFSSCIEKSTLLWSVGLDLLHEIENSNVRTLTCKAIGFEIHNYPINLIACNFYVRLLIRGEKSARGGDDELSAGRFRSILFYWLIVRNLQNKVCSTYN